MRLLIYRHLLLLILLNTIGKLLILVLTNYLLIIDRHFLLLIDLLLMFIALKNGQIRCDYCEIVLFLMIAAQKNNQFSS